MSFKRRLNFDEVPDKKVKIVQLDEDDSTVEFDHSEDDHEDTSINTNLTNNSMKLAAFTGILSPDVEIRGFNYNMNNNYDTVLVRLADYNPNFRDEFNCLKKFFDDDEIDESRQDVIGFLTKQELINTTNVFVYNKDSLVFKMDFPRGFIDYLCDAANESESNIIDFNQYNPTMFENDLIAATRGITDGSSTPPLTKELKTSNKVSKNLNIGLCQVISTFGSNIELARPLKACRMWFRGCIEVKAHQSSNSNKNNTTFNGFILRPDTMAASTYVNGIFRNDDYFQFAKGIYFHNCGSSYRYYCLKNGERTCKIEHAYEPLKEKEVIVEFTNLSVMMMNNTKFLLRGIVKRIIDLEWITKKAFN